MEEIESLVYRKYLAMPIPCLKIAGKYPIITFEEFIIIAREAPRVVGIYPEIKNPVLMNQYVSCMSIFIGILKNDLKGSCTTTRFNLQKMMNLLAFISPENDTFIFVTKSLFNIGR